MQVVFKTSFTVCTYIRTWILMSSHPSTLFVFTVIIVLSLIIVYVHAEKSPNKGHSRTAFLSFIGRLSSLGGSKCLEL